MSLFAFQISVPLGGLDQFGESRVKKTAACFVKFDVVKLFVLIADDLNNCPDSKFGVLDFVAYSQALERNRCAGFL